MRWRLPTTPTTRSRRCSATRPGRRCTATRPPRPSGVRRAVEASPLATLVRLFLLQAPVPRYDAERALAPRALRSYDALAAAGALVGAGGEVRAGVDVRPYADDDHAWWVVSDLTPGLDGEPIRVEPDHVLGVSPASTSLAQLTIRDRVGRALDLGTGCGVQSLHLAGHSDHVVATDVNPRALAMARFNAALNGIDLDVRDGSLWEPVAGERFDLVTTNPPFVISRRPVSEANGWSTATPVCPATRSSRPSSAGRRRT